MELLQAAARRQGAVAVDG